MPTPKQSPLTESILQKFGKLILKGEIKDDTKLVRDAVTNKPYTFRNAKSFRAEPWIDGTLIIKDADGLPVPPEIGVDVTTDTKYAPIIIEAVQSRFKSIRDDNGKQNHNLATMVTYVKTKVNLKERYVKETYLNPLWDVLTREDKGQIVTFVSFVNRSSCCLV